MKNNFFLYLLGFALFDMNNAIADTSVHSVKVETLSALASYPERTAPATVMSMNETTVSAELAARIIELNVNVGDSVEKGQNIAKLDCRDYVLERREAIAQSKALDARITLAEKRLQRAQKLRDKQTLAEEILDERESELSVSQADRSALRATIEQAQTRESRCNIKAPFTGIVIERQASIGEYATAGTPLITLVDTANIEVSAQLYSADAETLSEHKELNFREANNDFPLTVKHILPLINSQTRNREIRLQFTQASAYVGTAGQLVWQDTRPHVAAQLLVRRNNQLGIFYVKDNNAHFFAIPDAQAGQSNPVNLPKESLIITEGQYSLQDGMAVNIQE